MDKKYSVPVYENGKNINKPIEGIIGDDKYKILIKYGKGKLPDILNVKTK